MAIHRRHFLQGMAAASVLPLGVGLPRVLNAQSMRAQDHFFVILNIWGAMDVTLSLDPWTQPELPDPQDMFIEYSPSEVIEWDTGVKVGPALEVMGKHSNDMTIVNGVFMGEVDLSHETFREYMITGSLQGLSSSFALESSSYLGQNVLGSIVDSSRFPTGAHLVSSLADLKVMKNVDPGLLEIVNVMPKNDAFSFVKSILDIPVSLPAIQKFVKMKKEFSKNNEITEPHLLAAAFLSGSAMSAQIDFEEFDMGVYSLDTHGDHPQTHLERQIKAWEIVDDFFTTFKSVPFGDQGKSLFDHTTFLVSNEFARKPALNSRNGKDHNPLTNSVVLAGRGIRGGQVIGGSRSIGRKISPAGQPYHIALPINYDTGETLFSKQLESHMIFPENIMATLCDVFSMPILQHPALHKSTRSLQTILE